MENVLNQKDKVAEEVALKQLQQFVNKYTYNEVEFAKLQEDYPQALKAIQKGLLVFDDQLVPTYSLAFPIETEIVENSIKTVQFKTRIKPRTLANITKGIEVSKNQMAFTLKCLAYLSGLSEGELDLLEKFDYKAIEQVSTVFF
jgi:uncharacterized UPF0160 family protein